MDLTIILGALTPLKQWFEFLRTNNRERDNQYQEAIGALYAALNETRIYIGQLDRNRLSCRQDMELTAKPRNMETEATLSRLWTTASLKLRHFDRSLAERCFLKGDYWANPDEWTEQDIRRARIKIDNLFKEARKLL